MIEGTFTIDSTLDGVTGLLSKYSYLENETNLPIVVLVHGYNLTIDAIDNEILNRIASQGYFTVAVGMRGRKGASGRRDASAREVHDIYDAINHIQSNFSTINKIVVSGYSGGGGSALAFAVKFPYVANTIVNHFGMVDYAFDDVESWYFRNTQYQDGIVNFVGYPRIPKNMNYYRSRNTHEALENIQAKLYSYHDTGDGAVSVQLTNHLTSRLVELNKDHQTKISTQNDSVRFLHNMSVSAKTESEWLPRAKIESKPTTPTNGELKIIGYVVTDDFSIFLGNLDDNVANLTFDSTTQEFTIEPLTGTMQVKLIVGDLQQELTIVETTTFIFDGEPITPIEPEQEGRIKNYFVRQNGSYQKVKNKYLKHNGVWVLIK